MIIIQIIAGGAWDHHHFFIIIIVSSDCTMGFFFLWKDFSFFFYCGHSICIWHCPTYFRQTWAFALTFVLTKNKVVSLDAFLKHRPFSLCQWGWHYGHENSWHGEAHDITFDLILLRCPFWPKCANSQLGAIQSTWPRWSKNKHSWKNPSVLFWTQWCTELLHVVLWFVLTYLQARHNCVNILCWVMHIRSLCSNIPYS